MHGLDRRGDRERPCRGLVTARQRSIGRSGGALESRAVRSRRRDRPSVPRIREDPSVRSYRLRRARTPLPVTTTRRTGRFVRCQEKCADRAGFGRWSKGIPARGIRRSADRCRETTAAICSGDQCVPSIERERGHYHVGQISAQRVRCRLHRAFRRRPRRSLSRVGWCRSQRSGRSPASGDSRRSRASSVEVGRETREVQPSNRDRDIGRLDRADRCAQSSVG